MLHPGGTLTEYTVMALPSALRLSLQHAYPLHF